MSVTGTKKYVLYGVGVEAEYFLGCITGYFFLH